MSGKGADWPGVFGYQAPKRDTDGEGYWIFAPALSGEIELFQLSIVTLGSHFRELRFTATTADGVHDFRLHPKDGEKVAKAADRNRAPDAYPKLQAWLERVQARPAYQRMLARALPDGPPPQPGVAK